MKHSDIFEKLDPPPGGLAKLRGRLEARARSPWRRGLWVPVVAAVAILVFVRRGGGTRDVLSAARSFDGASEVGLGLAPLPDAPLTLADESQKTAAITRVPTSDPRVAMYLMGTLR
jgi:hypothetical protein